MPPSIESGDPIWWGDPWWEDELYQREFALSLDQIRASIEDLKKVFHEEWMRTAFELGPPNTVIATLYGGKGLWPFQNLMWLSRIASAVVNIPGAHRPLRDLAGQKSWAVLLELEVASWFVEKGWQVEFLRPSVERKTPDLRVQKDGVSTAIECKRFGLEQWEEWARELSFAVIRGIEASQSGSGPAFDVLFEPRLSDLVWDDKSIRDGVRNELAERIAAGILEATNSLPPRSVSIPGVAEIKLRPDLEVSGLHKIGGIEVSPQGKMRRIVRNGILEAAQQLREFGAGAVVIKSDFTPPKELVEAALLGLNRVDASLLGSVAVVVITASRGSRAVIWRNPALAQHFGSDILIRAFEELLLPH